MRTYRFWYASRHEKTGCYCSTVCMALRLRVRLIIWRLTGEGRLRSGKIRNSGPVDRPKMGFRSFERHRTRPLINYQTDSYWPQRQIQERAVSQVTNIWVCPLSPPADLETDIPLSASLGRGREGPLWVECSPSFNPSKPLCKGTSGGNQTLGSLASIADHRLQKSARPAHRAEKRRLQGDHALRGREAPISGRAVPSRHA